MNSQENAAAKEQTKFRVVLTEVGPNKVKVIKVVREITGLGIKEAKYVVEYVAYEAPAAVMIGAGKAAAEAAKAKLEAVGCKAEIR